MPPKKKEKKKSKKDIEKEKLLEEERLRAEEEARQAEQARKEQELLERQQREALEAIFVQDAARFDSEAAELATLTATRASRLEAILKSRREEAEWQAYLQCRPLPNPLNERNLVTYLDEWAVDSERDENSFSLEKLYTELPGIDILCGEIEQHLHAPADGRNARSEALGRDLIRIRELINGKWNMATMRTLQHIDQFPREANENFQFLSTTKDYVYGIWGNLTKNPRHKVIEFPSVHISASLPKPLVLANIAIRLLLESGITATATYEKQEGPTPMSVIGPVLQLDLIEMPDMPKVVDAWTIRPMVSKDGKIKRITYPFKKEATEEDEDLAEKPDTAPAGDDSQSGADGPGPAVSDSSLWPTTVTFQLEPGCLLHNGVATVRWWNSKMEWWDEDGIADVEIDPASGLVRFKTIHFAPTAVVQYTYAEFPYEDWSIRPIAPNSAILHIRGLLNDLEIEVGPGKCRALRPALDLSQLAEGEAWLFPAILFRRLSRIGANFQGPPPNKIVELDDLILKNPTVEQLCITAISACSGDIMFRRSQANHLVSSSKCVFQFRKSKPDDSWPLPEETEWHTLVFDGQWQVGENFKQAGYVVPPGKEVTENTTFAAEGPESAKQVHATPYHLLRSVIQDETTSTDDDFVLFSKTMAEVLTLSRLLCFA